MCIRDSLTPFHRSTSGDWWTSLNSRNIADLGYTYPELIDNPSNETLIFRINALYRDSDLATQGKELSMLVSDVEYIVQVKMPASESLSYNVLLFLGEVSDDPASWTTQKSFVSKTSSVVATSAERLFSTLGTIVLTNFVNARIVDGHLRKEDILEYLKTNLQWRLGLVCIGSR